MLLAKHFVARHAQQAGRDIRLSKIAVAALQSYPWPGNVRELEHIIARAALLCEGTEILNLQLPAATSRPSNPDHDLASYGPSNPAVMTLKEAEKRAITTAMSHHGGDKTKAAKTLGISRTALYDKLKRHGLSD